MDAGMKGLIDAYDEEFFTNLEIAKNLIARISHPSEKQICKKWISKLCALKSSDPVVKKNRNHFFKYMLQILHKGVEDAPEAHLGYPQYDDRFGGGPEEVEEAKDFMSRWSGDRRTYVAAKPMPGLGALVYMAVAKDPSLGWDMPTLK